MTRWKACAAAVALAVLAAHPWTYGIGGSKLNGTPVTPRDLAVALTVGLAALVLLGGVPGESRLHGWARVVAGAMLALLTVPLAGMLAAVAVAGLRELPLTTWWLGLDLPTVALALAAFAASCALRLALTGLLEVSRRTAPRG